MTVQAENLVTDKTALIPSADLRPSLSDPRFLEQHIGQLLVFQAEGREVDDLYYLDSRSIGVTAPDDRAAERAWRAAERATGNRDSALFFERYLGGVLGRETVEVQEILSAVDQMGYSYHYFGLVDREAGERLHANHE